MGKAMGREVATPQRRLDPRVDAIVFEVARAGMLGVETSRHALLRGTLELVALPLEPLDHAVERASAAIVENRFAVPLENFRIGHVQADREHRGLRRQVDPVTRRSLLLATLPPPKRLVVLVRLLVPREANVTVDPLHAIVRARIDLQMRTQLAELRAELDHELLRRLEHVLLVFGAVRVEPVLAIVSPQGGQKAGGPVRKSILHRADSSERGRNA